MSDAIDAPSPLAPTRLALWLAVLVFLIAMVARVGWLTRIEPINDEMLHLESYRHRYSEGWQHPVAQRRLETMPRLQGPRGDAIRTLYRDSFLFRVALFEIGDTPSQTYGLIVDPIRSWFGPSVQSIRVPSLVFAATALWLMFFIGRALRDDALGLTLMSAAACSPLAEAYAAIGRPHSLAYAGFCAVMLGFVVARRRGEAGSWRVFLPALCAQAFHWGLWLMIFSFVAAEFALLVHRHRAVGPVVRRCWWYVLGSVALVGVFLVVNFATTANKNVGFAGAATLVEWFGVGSPLGALYRFGTTASIVAAGVTLAVTLVGVVALWRDRREDRVLAATFAAALLFTAISAVLMCNGIRHMMLYTPVPIVLAGVGAWVLLRSHTARLAVTLGAFAVLQGLLAIARPDPYAVLFASEMRYSQAAAVLRTNVGATDRWTSWPYFFADCLYPHPPLPKPVLSFDASLFAQALDDRSYDGHLYVFGLTIEPAVGALAKTAVRRWDFANDFVVLELDRRRQPPYVVPTTMPANE